MEYLRRLNLWVLLLALFVVKLWAAMDEGKMGLLLLTVMTGLSVLSMLSVEKNTTKRSLGWQSVVCIVYIAFTLIVFTLFGLKEKEWMFLKSLVPYNLWPTFLIDAFGAAVLEEIVFRRILLHSLLKRMSRMKSIVLSSIIFYFFHFSIMATIVISGIFYASFTLRWSSLLLAIGVHTFYDFLGNMAKSVEHVSVTFTVGLNAYQVLHGGGALAHFMFIAFYFTALLLYDGVVAGKKKIKLCRRHVERIAR